MNRRLLCLLCIALALAGCAAGTGAQSSGQEMLSSAQPSFPAAESSSPEPEAPAHELPMLFCSQELAWASGQTATLEILLLDGAYEEDFSHPYNMLWNGEGEIRITFADGHSSAAPWSVAADGPFELVLDDYNGDGDPDFTYAADFFDSGHLYFELYTVRADGTVEALPIEPFAQERFYTACFAYDKPRSIPLYREGADGFWALRYYGAGADSDYTGYVKQLYVWLDGRFAAAGEEIPIDREEARVLHFIEMDPVDELE